MLQVSFTFSANKALIASAVFMTNLELCSWLGFENRNFVPEGVFRWDFVHFRYVASLMWSKTKDGGNLKTVFTAFVARLAIVVVVLV